MQEILKDDITLEKIKIYLVKSRSKTFLENSKKILNDSEFELSPFKFKIQKNKEIEWINDEKHSRSLLRLLNGFVFLGDLIEAYLTTNEKKFIDKGIEIIYDWCNSISYELHKNTMAYHDETTALRMEYFISFLINAKNVISDTNKEYILSKCQFIADLLVRDDFHSKNTNHGMFQDLALLKYGVIVNNNVFVEKAIKRLNDYFEFVYTSEGIHKEHSPAYHMMVSSNLKRYVSFLNEFRLNRSIQLDVKAILEKAEEFIIYITRPDGCVPNISDTEKRELRLIYPNLFTSDRYRFVLSSGENGEAPTENSKVFKESGYAIFRDDWNKKEKASHVIFTAAYHTGYHKHTDDLNVLFYSGEDILVEAGANGYNYRDPFTKYAYSAQAHNTLNVINKQLPRHDNKMDKVKMIDYYINKEYSMAIGKNERYENVIHTRKVKYYNDSNILEVSDNIESVELNEYILNWHFAKGISLEVRDNKVILVKDNKKIGLVKIFSDTKYEINIINGKDRGVIQGWYFEKMEYKEPINNIEVRFKGKNAKFVTQIIVYTQKEKEYQIDIINNEKIYFNKENIKYLLEKDSSSDKLCIVFSAMGEKNKFVYNYMNTLNECKINKLFILDEFDIQGSYYLGKNRGLEIEDTVISLIMFVAKELDIKLKDIILVGSSKGGYAALYYGIKYNLGSVIVGAPQSKLGDFLIDQAKHLEIAKFVSGGIGNEDKEFLNNILYKVIDNNKRINIRICIHVGEGDYHYEHHILPLVSYFDQLGIVYNLDIANYEGHKKLKQYFPKYLLGEINKVDENIISKESIKNLQVRHFIEYKMSIKNNKVLIDILNADSDSKFAYYLFNEMECIEKTQYSRAVKYESKVLSSGKYRVRIFELLFNNERKSIYTNYVDLCN